MIALLLAGVLLLTGCGGGAAKYGPVNKNGQQGVSKDGKLHLTFYFPVQVGGETAKLIETICNDFSKEHAEKVVFDWIVKNEYPMGQVMNTFRIAIVGAGSGPSIMDICAIIGKEETLRRIDNALLRLNRNETAE